MTSSDVLDTSLAVQLARAQPTFSSKTWMRCWPPSNAARSNIKTRPPSAAATASTPSRSRFGLKLAGYYAEFKRAAKERLVAARKEIATCAISGAVGTFANIDPFVEQYVAKKMGLTVEPVSTQVIPRDRHAMYFATLGVIASSMERLATEVRHLAAHAKCSKLRNISRPAKRAAPPCRTSATRCFPENVTGLARLVRGYRYARIGKCGAVA